MASLTEAEASCNASNQVNDPVMELSTSKHDTSDVSEGNTTFNTCLDETIRLSDLETSTVSSNVDPLDLTIPKSEVTEKVVDPVPEHANLDSKANAEVGASGLKTKNEPKEEIKLESASDSVKMAEKPSEPSDKIGGSSKEEVTASLPELVVNPTVKSSSESEDLPQEKESLPQEKESQPQEKESLSQEKESLPQEKESLRQEKESLLQEKESVSLDKESLPREELLKVKLPEFIPEIGNKVESEVSPIAVSRAAESLDVGYTDNKTPSAVAGLDESFDSGSKLNESGSGASVLEESSESVHRLNKSLDSALSEGDVHSESGAEDTIQAAEYEREDGDGQEYDSSDGEIGTSDSEGEEAPVEQVKEKKIDDDEDRRNPQYIPKRGTFYEHDDRTADDDTSTGNNAETETDRTNEQHADKKVWKEHENRWTHDGYNEEEQQPKTRQEIIDTYGYDIRNEENAPRAVRRNKYGRGPNTYTRTWEDEKAYKRPSGAAPSGGRGGNRGRDREPRSQTFYSNKVAGRNTERTQGPRKEAFPALPGDARRDHSRSASPPARNDRQQPSAWSRSKETSSRDEYSKYGNNLPLQLTPPPQRREIEVVRVPAPAPAAPAARFSQPSTDNIKPFRKAAGRGVASPRDTQTEPNLPGRGRGKDLTNKRSGSGRIGGDVRQLPAEPAKREARDGAQQWAKTPASAAPKLKNQQDLANDLARMNVSPAQAQKAPVVDNQHYSGAQEYTRRAPGNEPSRNTQGYQQQQQQHERRQTEVPPRLQQQESAAKDAAANRPKRYSAIQQRSLPEPGAPIPQQQQQQQAPAYAQQHQYYQHPPNFVQPPQPPLQMMTAVHPPTTYAPTFSAAPAFIQPPGPAPPPPHLMRRPPSPGHYHAAPPHAPQAVIGYVQQAQPHPPQFQPQPYPPFQAFAAVQAATSAPPPELGLYQPQGGITYYSPAEQMRSRQQMTSERRQRAAIPIVPPPEYGRAAHRRADDSGYDQRDYGGAGDQGSYSDEDGQDDDYDDYNGSRDATEGMTRKIKQCEG